MPLPLREQFECAGNWLFRRRSVLPLFLLGPFAVAMGNYSYPFSNHQFEIPWEWLCFAVSFTGLAIRAATVAYVPRGTSGRNTLRQKAEVLNTTGLYSVVRHPLYVGNFLLIFGVALFPHQPWLALCTVLAFALYYERIMFAEEEFLRVKFGREYLDWAQNTPAVFPLKLQWKAPALPFSLRHVLKREYNSLFALVCVYFALDAASDLAVDKRVILHPVWLTLLVVALISSTVLRFLKKHTRVLSVEGR